MRLRRATFLVSFAAALWIAIAGCGDDDDATPTTDGGPDGTPDVGLDTASQDVVTDVAPDGRSPEFTGSACKVAADCYGGLDAASLKGTPYCIDKVTNGYCTHTCTTDADCCATPGECRTGYKQVCSPFENQNEKYCFLSCEPADITAAPDGGGVDGGDEGSAYCSKNVSSDFSCRSSGGGTGNRKVCLPTGGGDGGKPDSGDASDAADADGG